MTAPLGCDATGNVDAESAVRLLNDMPTLGGGLWTTAPAMGKKLISRLQANER